MGLLSVAESQAIAGLHGFSEFPRHFWFKTKILFKIPSFFIWLLRSGNYAFLKHSFSGCYKSAVFTLSKHRFHDVISAEWTAHFSGFIFTERCFDFDARDFCPNHCVFAYVLYIENSLHAFITKQVIFIVAKRIVQTMFVLCFYFILLQRALLRKCANVLNVQK